MDKKKSLKKVSHKKSWKSKPLVKKPNRDWRFKQVDSYKVKPEPFPRVLYTRCKYSDDISLIQGIANQAVYKSYYMTTIYDPDQVTHFTVTGWNQLQSIYGRYLVTGAKVYLSFTAPSSPSARVGYRIRLAGQGNPGAQALQTLSSQPLTYLSGLNASGKNTKNFSFFVRPWTLMGMSKLEYMANSSVYSSAINSNPANVNLGVIDVILCDPDSTNDVNYSIKIVYYVKLYNRNMLFEELIV